MFGEFFYSLNEELKIQTLVFFAYFAPLRRDSLFIFRIEASFRQGVLQVPDIYARVVGSRGQIAPVGREAHEASAQFMRLKALQHDTGPGIEQIYRAVGLTADARQRPAVAAEADRLDDAVMRRRQNLQAAVIEPPAEQVEPAAAHEKSPVGREGQVLCVRGWRE